MYCPKANNYCRHDHQQFPHSLPTQGGKGRSIAPVPTVSTTIIITDGSINTNTFIPYLHRVAEGDALLQCRQSAPPSSSPTVAATPPSSPTCIGWRMASPPPRPHHRQQLLHPFTTITTKNSYIPYLHRLGDGDVLAQVPPPPLQLPPPAAPTHPSSTCIGWQMAMYRSTANTTVIQTEAKSAMLRRIVEMCSAAKNKSSCSRRQLIRCSVTMLADRMSRTMRSATARAVR